MSAARSLVVAAFMTLVSVSCAPRVAATGTSGATARSPLVGAWRLVALEGPGPDGQMQRDTSAKGSLIYTPDGAVSVQVMFADAVSAHSDAPVQYAKDGYEASFGRYVVDEATRTVTHHYDGSLVRSLLGQDLPRRFELAGGRLIIRSTRADEKWAVTWERF
jgi:hypothetical protein